jgi:hypothetical protein
MSRQTHDLHVGIAPPGEALRAGDGPQRPVPEWSARLEDDVLSAELIDELVAAAPLLPFPWSPADQLFLRRHDADDGVAVVVVNDLGTVVAMMHPDQAKLFWPEMVLEELESWEPVRFPEDGGV